jgi:hypothetical protein
MKILIKFLISYLTVLRSYTSNINQYFLYYYYYLILQHKIIITNINICIFFITDFLKLEPLS